MELILDASAVLAWFVQRTDPREAALADEILSSVERKEAVFPASGTPKWPMGSWLQSARACDPSKSSRFLSELAALPITEERVQQSSIQAEVLALGRRYGLTACDAIYVELSLRTGLALATFDAQFADAVRKAGGRVFGDAG